MTYRDREKTEPPHRLLALDGGGIRGVMTLQVLEQIESMLRQELGAGPDFVLADWFDYVGGTSTGAIIAAGLAKGMTVSDLQELYETLGPKMFQKPWLGKRFWSKYVSQPLAEELKRQFGTDTQFGDVSLRALLLIVLHNTSTSSPWPLSNASCGTYNRDGVPGNNLKLPLWQLVRASAAAPTFFPAERVHITGKLHTFQDGGITTFNNPALQLFLMTTMDAFGLNWATGADKMLLVSVGTGLSEKVHANLRMSRLNLYNHAKEIPGTLMLAAQVQQDMVCRVLGDCKIGNWLDGELQFLMPERGVLQEKLFTYLRFNATLDEDGMNDLGLSGIDYEKAARLDSIDHVDDLKRIGRAIAQKVDPAHFRPFLQPVRSR